MNLSNFQFNTDYPVDKIVWMWEGNVSPSTSELVIPHHLGAVPFCQGVLSPDDWRTTYPSGTTVLAESQQYSVLSFSVRSDGNNVYVYYYGDDAAPAKVRLWGVFNEAETWNIEAPGTSVSPGGNFIFNSEFKYPNLAFEGEVGPSDSPAVISHNLGYVPYVDVWVLAAGKWGQDTIPFLDNYIMSVDKNNLTFNRLDNKYYYRIYAHDSSL